MTKAEKDAIAAIKADESASESVKAAVDNILSSAVDEVDADEIAAVAEERDALRAERDDYRTKYEDMKAKYIKRIVTPSGEKITYETERDEQPDDTMDIFEEKEIVK